MRGNSIPKSLFEIVENRKSFPESDPVDLEDYIGDREKTQEMKCLKTLATEAIFSDLLIIRDLCRKSLRLCSYELIKDVFVKNNKLYFRLSDSTSRSIEVYVYDLPKEYIEKRIYPSNQ